MCIRDRGKSTEKSDDPIRMYLREMGGVELLSREGEIAIAKRIDELEQKLMDNFDEKSYSDLIELKKQINKE